MALVVVTVIVVLGGLAFLAAQEGCRMNAVPAIGISDMTTAEVGCLTPSPRVIFIVTIWNMGFASGVVHISFYQDGLFLGSDEWTVDGRTPGIDKSVTYHITSRGGHVYSYHLDAVT